MGSVAPAFPNRDTFSAVSLGPLDRERIQHRQTVHLNFMRRRNSSFIGRVGYGAEALAGHIAAWLNAAAADHHLTEMNSTLPQPKTTLVSMHGPTLTPDKCRVGAAIHALQTMEAKMTAIKNIPNDARLRSHPLLETPSRLIAAIQQFVRLRRDRLELDGLPDHILRDIGIDRSEIGAITIYRGRDDTRRNRP